MKDFLNLRNNSYYFKMEKKHLLYTFSLLKLDEAKRLKMKINKNICKFQILI